MDEEAEEVPVLILAAATIGVFDVNSDGSSVLDDVDDVTAVAVVVGGGFDLM
jgi:hypothetical protein